MNKPDLVSYYAEKSKEWIFVPQVQYIKIFDDEILDLDSISLNSNEDTWLYSSDSVVSDQSINTSSNTDNEELIKESSFCQKIESSLCNNVKNNLSTDEEIFSPSIIMIDQTDFPRDELSNSAINNFLKVTPINTKLKQSFLKDVSMHHQQLNGSNHDNSKTESQFLKSKTEGGKNKTDSSSENDNFVFKKPYDTVEKSYILHSVENKLFKITDTDTKDSMNSLNYKNMQNREIKDADNARKSLYYKTNEKPSNIFNNSGKLNISETNSENKYASETYKFNTSTPSKPVIQNPFSTESESFHVPEFKLTENDENINKFSLKKQLPLCQSTPMLLNRFLKYNSNEEKNKNTFTKYRFSIECTKEQIDEINRTGKLDRDQMNISDIKSSSRDIVEISPTENITKSNINSKYSKSDDVLNSPCEIDIVNNLNSTFNVAIEDDVVSTTSESSLSSISNKCFLSAKDVHRNAELQELRLRSPVPTSYYGESSKSSEVSSSSESICASENTKVLSNVIKDNSNLNKRNSMYQKATNETILSSKNNGTLSRTNMLSAVQQKSLMNGDVKKIPISARKTRLENIFKNKTLSATNCITTDIPVTSITKQNGIHSICPIIKQPISKEMVEESVTVKEIKLKPDCEMKLVDDTKSPQTQKVLSHIPRPSSRIPMLRTSTSCNRYSKGKNEN